MSHATHSNDTVEDADPALDWDESRDAVEDDDAFTPGRRRMRWLSPKSAVLFAVLVGVIGFYGGIRAEKSNASGSTGGTLAAPATSGTRSPTGGFQSFGSGGSGGPGGAAGGATSGTVTSVKGDTVYIKESSGNTVAVKLLATTTVNKSESVSANAVHPGDTVAVQGSTGKTGTVTATSVTDQGDSSTTSTTKGS